MPFEAEWASDMEQQVTAQQPTLNRGMMLNTSPNAKSIQSLILKPCTAIATAIIKRTIRMKFQLRIIVFILSLFKINKNFGAVSRRDAVISCCQRFNIKKLFK